MIARGGGPTLVTILMEPEPEEEEEDDGDVGERRLGDGTELVAATASSIVVDYHRLLDGTDGT